MAPTTNEREAFAQRVEAAAARAEAAAWRAECCVIQIIYFRTEAALWRLANQALKLTVCKSHVGNGGFRDRYLAEMVWPEL